MTIVQQLITTRLHTTFQRLNDRANNVNVYSIKIKGWRHKQLTLSACLFWTLILLVIWNDVKLLAKCSRILCVFDLR